MKSSIMNKSFLAVVMLMVACFAGFAVVGEDTDAAAMPYGVDFGGEKVYKDHLMPGVLGAGEEIKISNAILGNEIEFVDGKIVGTIAKAPAGYTKAIWWSSAVGDHIVIINVTGIPVGTYVTWASEISETDAYVHAGATEPAKDPVGPYKQTQIGTNGTLSLAIALDESDEGFTFWVSAAPLINADATQRGELKAEVTTENGVISAIYPSYTIGFDLELLGDAIDVKYKVGDLTYVYDAIAGQDYQLVTLDNLRAIAPEGYEFDAWIDAKGNRYLAGSTLKLDADTTFIAQFKEIPVQEVFKVEFVVDGIVSQTCMSDNVIIPTNPAKEGFKFLNWAVDGVFANPANYAYTEDTQFVAQWEAYVYTVTFMAGGEIVGTPQTVKHGDLILAPALPAGYESWNFDFTQPIKSNTIIVAVEAPEPEPTGADNPMTLTVYILVAFVIVGLIACFVYLLREGRIVIGLGKKKEIEAPVQEEPKQ